MTPSSKGLPQEIVQDASRILANFYIKDLDLKFHEECKLKGVKFLRWADDITFIGTDKAMLETLVHSYSLELHKLGLNLNAAKTHCHSKREIEEYNCMDIMRNFKSKNPNEINVGIEWFRSRQGTKNVREDRVIRRLLTILTQEPYLASDKKAWISWPERNHHKTWLKSFITTRGYDALKLLDANRLTKFFELYSNPVDGLIEASTIIAAKPYTNSKAELLRAIKKLKNTKRYKIDPVQLESCKLQILQSAQDSSIITRYCA